MSEALFYHLERRGLEDVLPGLLERTRGNVQLTPAGEILYQVSKDIVQRYQEIGRAHV